jgi:hypothetical protein
LLVLRQRLFASRRQLRNGVVVDAASAAVEFADDFQRELVFMGVHIAIPCFLSNISKASVAREQ